MAIFAILLSIAAIIILITKVKLHPFLALLVVSIFFGLLTGMKSELIIASIQDGFGGTIGKVGLIIILGVLIGAFLEHSGGALVLAHKILSLTGKKRVSTAMGISGYFISIPVFSDSGFVLLSSLNKTLTKKAGLSLGGTAIALGLGLSCTHALVPPTPGPIAAAGILQADIALVMLLGGITSAIALGAALLFVNKVASKTYIDPGPLVENAEVSTNQPPGLLMSSLPIVVPVALIVLKSISSFQPEESLSPWVLSWINFLGEPMVALLIGFALCLFLPRNFKTEYLSVNGWTGKALTQAAHIIFVTGAGGIFGKILQNSDIVDLLGEGLAGSEMGIFFPFLLAAGLKTAQGSSTVALITTASVMQPLMANIGFISEWDKAMVVVAIGAGSLVVSHVNDSFFWVVTQMSNMDVKTGHKLHTTGTLVIGCAAMATLYVLYLIMQ
ncbi:MAG TPA: GntP family permease [Saprospiraceae bacterium]|mgnify:CR=1 FL=1|nr:GntP family permease [Saprospiraceae bacterium]